MEIVVKITQLLSVVAYYSICTYKILLAYFNVVGVPTTVFMNVLGVTKNMHNCCNNCVISGHPLFEIDARS
jgi:hypothetical protein